MRAQRARLASGPGRRAHAVALQHFRNCAALAARQPSPERRWGAPGAPRCRADVALEEEHRPPGRGEGSARSPHWYFTVSESRGAGSALHQHLAETRRRHEAALGSRSCSGSARRRAADTHRAGNHLVRGGENHLSRGATQDSSATHRGVKLAKADSRCARPRGNHNGGEAGELGGQRRSRSRARKWTGDPSELSRRGATDA